VDQLVQDRDHWLALVNSVMNLWVLVPLSLLKQNEVSDAAFQVGYPHRNC
jgi:hypothetical protein